MSIIVTGGAGFIGSAIVWRLNELGHDEILIVDRLDETDKWKNLAPLKFTDYIDADDFIDDLGHFADSSVIFHLGACSSTTERDAEIADRQLAMPGEQEMAEPSDNLPDEGAQLQGQQSDDKLQPAEEQIHKILPHA